MWGGASTGPASSFPVHDFGCEATPEALAPASGHSDPTQLAKEAGSRTEDRQARAPRRDVIAPPRGAARPRPLRQRPGPSPGSGGQRLPPPCGLFRRVRGLPPSLLPSRPPPARRWPGPRARASVPAMGGTALRARRLRVRRRPAGRGLRAGAGRGWRGAWRRPGWEGGACAGGRGGGRLLASGLLPGTPTLAAPLALPCA